MWLVSTEFAGSNRGELQEERTVGTEVIPDDEFDTNIHGPWMRRWDIVHHNRHTAALTGDSSWQSEKPGHKA